MVKWLYLLRHGKAERGTPPGGTDRARHLAERGTIESRLMGAHCRGLGHPPGFALCSPATRTRETLAAFRDGLGTALPAREAERLYMGPPEVLLDEIRAPGAPGGDPDALIVIGHNPSIHGLALALARLSRGPAAHRLAEAFPTAALAIFEARIESWAALGRGGTELSAYVTPKDIR